MVENPSLASERDRVGADPNERIHQRAIVAYFGLAFLLSWSVEILLIASENAWDGIAVPPWLHYLAAYGPMLASFVVTGWVLGGSGLREHFGRVTKARVGWGWWLISLLSPAALFAVGALIAWVVEGSPPDLGLLGGGELHAEPRPGGLAVLVPDVRAR